MVMKHKGQLLCLSLLVVLASSLIGMGDPAHAQKKYPTRAIDIIVPFGPGAATDISTRIMADFLKRKWHIPVNVINKAGGNGIPACLEVHQSTPDGYTLLADNTNSASMVKAVRKDLPYEVMDRTFIGMTSGAYMIIIVPHASPFKNITDVVENMKKDPGNFTWSSLGGTGTQDVAALQLFKAVGVDVTKTKPIISSGGAQAVTMTAGNNVKMGVGTTGNVLAALDAKTIRLLALTSKTREKRFPDVPTFAELGYPTVDSTYWIGVSGPPKLPLEIVNTWTETLQEMTKDTKYNEQMKNANIMVRYVGPSETRQVILKEVEEMKDLVGTKK